MGERTYAMGNRAEAAARTRESILQAAYELWLTDDYDEVSLERVAERAGVSKQTVIRLFGAKDQLAVAVVDWQRPREEAARVVEPGDLNAAVDVLVARYEEIGDANVRLLALEQRVPAIGYLLAQARESHRAWIEHAFAPYLPKRRGAARTRRVIAFYAATEVMLWKLIRRDFKQSRSDVHAVFLDLVSSLAARSGAT